MRASFRLYLKNNACNTSLIYLIVLSNHHWQMLYQTNQQLDPYPRCHPITVTSWSTQLGLKIPASRLFAQQFVEAQFKENIKSYESLAFVMGIHRWRVDSHHKGPVTRKTFPFDDVTMQMWIDYSWLMGCYDPITCCCLFECESYKI